MGAVEQEHKFTQTVRNLTALQQIACSSVSGSLGIFVGFPFDTIKIKLQTQRKGQYNGVVDCLRKVVREEGVKRLFGKCEVRIWYTNIAYVAGLMAPLSVAAARQTVIFSSNRVFNHFLDIDNTTFSHKVTALIIVYLFF